MKKSPAEERAGRSFPKAHRNETNKPPESNDVPPSIEPWVCATVNLTQWLRENSTWQIYLGKPPRTRR